MIRQELTRRAFLASGALAVAGLTLGAQASAAAAEPLRLRLSLQSPSAQTLIDGLAPSVQMALGLPVRVVAFRIDGQGRWPIEVVYDAPPSALDVLVAATPHLISMQSYHKTDLNLARLTRVGRLTKGDSYALVVPRSVDGAGLKAIDALGRHSPLLIAVPDTSGGFDLLATLAAREGRLQPNMLDVVSAGDALAEVSHGKAQMAVTLVRTFMAHRSVYPDLRILMISGSVRSPQFPEVPTLAEVSGVPELNFTSSLGLFGPPDMPAQTVALIGRAIGKAAGGPAAVTMAAKAGYVLQPGGPEALEADYARDVRILKRL